MTTFLPSPYHTSGRQGAVIDSIVVHWMAESLAATDAEFAAGPRHVSAHYGIEDTTIHQYVADVDTAWHAGDWPENTRSIGIEHSAAPGRPATAATIATSVDLMVTLCRRYGIDPAHIYPHNKFTTTDCPGTLPLAAMVASVRAQLDERTTMTRKMYDAVTPANIPFDAQMVAGYVDGRYAWKAADWARFPSAVKVRIAVFPSTNDGNCLDIERGDATPLQAPGWVAMRRKAGIDPSVYCSLSIWQNVKAAFQNAGVAEPHYWIAAYPGNGPNLYPGAVAHQYANPGPVDISVVADYWPGVDAAPVAPHGTPSQPSRSDTRPPLPTRNIPMTIAIQKAVHVTADGMWGNATSAAATAVIRRVLTNVPYLQGWVGVKADGVWGAHL